MTSHTRMLAGLALTAATVVTLSSDALARGGFGGMRSFSVARTPMVVRTTNTSAVRKTSATSHTTSSGTKTSSSGTKASQTKMHSCKKDCSDHHHKPPFNFMPPMPPMPASGSQVSSDPASQGATTPVASVGDVSDNRSAGVRHHRKAEDRDHRKDEDRDDRDGGSEDSESSSPQDSGGKDGGGQGGSGQGGGGQSGGQDVVVNDRGGTRAAVYPVATLPSGGSGNTGTTGIQGVGGTISKERPNPLPPTSAGTGAAAASAPADAPNCVYERTVQRLPDGRLQRVVLKVCPDA